MTISRLAPIPPADMLLFVAVAGAGGFTHAARKLGLSKQTVSERIARLDRALDLWHGQAVADFADEAWARGAAVRLDELRLAAEEARFDLLLDAGRHAVAVGELSAAVDAHPLRERFTAQLVLALYRCGRQSEALRAFERTRAHLGPYLQRMLARPAVQRGRKVNRVQGDPASQLRERHDASDFDTKTQDKIEAAAAAASSPAR